MLKRKYLFPNVIELNTQAGRKLGVNVYLVESGGEWILLDIGFEDTVDEIVEMIRQMDFSLSKCKLIVATHADADHIQGLKRAKEKLKAPIAAHPKSVSPLERGDVIETYAKISAQKIDLPMPAVKIDRKINEGDILEVGELKLTTWHTPGHTPGQLAFRMGNLLFSGDNIYRDGCVGVIDAHHGSNLCDFVKSLERILADDSSYLLPSHGPIFRRDPAIIQKAIDRLSGYMHMADFGTCAVDWPLETMWEEMIISGKPPLD